MNTGRLFLTLALSILISKTYSQGMNYAKSGREAVEGFLKTSISHYPDDSEEMLSYLLPSYKAAHTTNKVNTYPNTWKYDIEKTSGNVYYVAVYIERDYKEFCKLIVFETKQQDGQWYLVPSKTIEISGNYYSDPWANCSMETTYKPGAGPYNSIDKSIVDEDWSSFEAFNSLMLKTYAEDSDYELVKSWYRKNNKFNIEMGSPRYYNSHNFEDYNVKLEREYGYLLIVVGENTNLQPNIFIGYIPENKLIRTDKTEVGVDEKTLFPYTYLIFHPLIEEGTEQILINVNIGDPWLKEQYKISAHLFKFEKQTK